MNKPGKINLREQQRQKTRAEILEASLQVFAEKGFEGAAVRDIAARIGVNHGLIRHHFQNKENLWKEAVTHLYDRMNREFADVIDTEAEDQAAQARKIVKHVVKYFARHPEQVRIMMHESIRDGDRLDWAVENFIKPQHEVLAPIVRHWKSIGITPDIDPVALIYILVGASQTPFVTAPELERVYGQDVLDPVFVDKYADALIALIFERKIDA